MPEPSNRDDPPPSGQNPFVGGKPAEKPPRGAGPTNVAPMNVAPMRIQEFRGFCRRCQQRLYPGNTQCGRCGQIFDQHDTTTYLANREFFVWRFWFPGFCLAVAAGVISYAAIMVSGEMGSALFISVPISFGAILGYATRGGKILLLVLATLAVPLIALCLVGLGYAGFFCGGTLMLIFIVPTLVGLGLGVLLRVTMKQTRWDQRHFLPIVFLLALPYGCSWLESRFPRRKVVATVRTELTVAATPDEAWRALTFYEDVRHEPPLLLKLALPKPIRSEGRKQRVGDKLHCVYDRGHINKRITALEKNRRLAFVVTDQHLHFEHDVKLLDGSFALEDAGDGKTRIVLTTRYEKQLRPIWIWDPIERKVIHTLHEHVLEGIRRKAKTDDSAAPEYQPRPAGGKRLTRSRFNGAPSIPSREAS